MKKITVFFNKTLQLLAVAAIFCVAINANAQDRTFTYQFNGGTSGAAAGTFYDHTVPSVGGTYTFLTPNSPQLLLTRAGWVFTGWATNSSFPAYQDISWDGSNLTPPNIEFGMVSPADGLTLTAQWARAPLATICEEDGTTYVITGTAKNATSMNASIISGAPGDAVAVTVFDNTAVPPTFTVTYTIAGPGTKRIKLNFYDATNAECDDEVELEFIVNPTPILVLDDPSCQGTTGTIVLLDNPNPNDNTYQLVVSGTGITDMGWINWIDLTLGGLIPGSYDLYKRSSDGCIVMVTVTIVPCCVDEIEVVISSSGVASSGKK